MFLELSSCVNGQESEYPFSVNAYESEHFKTDESGNIYESPKICSVSLVQQHRMQHVSFIVPIYFLGEERGTYLKEVPYFEF